jgi:hypothetical protein
MDENIRQGEREISPTSNKKLYKRQSKLAFNNGECGLGWERILLY